MNLYAISDLHIGHAQNRQALQQLPFYPDDWLIVAGDVGETEEHLAEAMRLLTARFAQVLWTPGNHDLWTLPTDPSALRGEAKYRRLIEICREYNVLTPEDPYVRWPGAATPYLLAPLFLLYDYTFHPPEVAPADVLAWAAEQDTICADEVVLHPDPYATRAAWCEARCQYTERRLSAATAQLPPGGQLILINHFPLRYDLAVLPRIPRFTPWCGTRRTETWHTRFPVAVMIYGHLHIRNTQLRDNVRCEEVSLGYPRQWQVERGIAPYLRKILPVT